MIDFKQITLIGIVALLISAASFAASPAASYFNVKVGFVDSSIVMFYKGYDEGLAVGEEYNLYSETGWLARITVQKKETNFTSAKIDAGGIHSEYTGRYVAVFPVKIAPVPVAKTQPEEEPVVAKAEPDEDPAPVETKPAKTKPPKKEPIAAEPYDDSWEPAPPPAKKPLTYSMLVRFDAHSSDDYPDANIATIVSATRKANTSLTTFYVIGNSDISNRIPDYVGAGLNFTSFLSPLFNYSIGYSYQARDDVADDPDFKTRTDILTFGAAKVMLPKSYKNTSLVTSVNYSTKPNFRDNRSYSGNVQFSKKIFGDMRFAVSYKRLWQFAAAGFAHSLDQYGADLTLKLKDKRYTFGYYYLDRNNIFNRTSIDDDRNFRFTIYSSGK